MKRALGCVVVLVALVAVGCGDDDGDDGGDDGTSSNEQFCTELVEFGIQVGSNRNLTTPQAIAEYAEEVATQARELADVAPADVEDAADSLASAAEDAADAIADNDPERAAERNTDINERVQELTDYVEQNCPGVSVPTSTPG